MEEVRVLADNGFKEIVLTGIHVASYGKDIKNIDLLGIIKKVHEVSGIERIRFSSIEPNIITEEFVSEIVKLSKVCHHFHLSLQSGCDKTLKAMNRKYTTERYYDAVCTLRKYMPDVAITTDIIVGFPGETEEDFKESCDFAEKVGFSKIHVFPYSPKKGTPAAERKDQLLNSVKQERSKKLIAISDRMCQDFMKKYIGENVEVLFERNAKEDIYEGHTGNYIKVLAKSEKNISNKILDVKVSGIEGEDLIAFCNF